VLPLHVSVTDPDLSGTYLVKPNRVASGLSRHGLAWNGPICRASDERGLACVRANRSPNSAPSEFWRFRT
jgi:hypothetical protein